MTARILVVDDTPLNVKLLTAKLEHEYYLVSAAINGPAALESIDKEPPDIILLDVMMPEMDGFEVCRRIRANPATAHIPVVMVTALTDVTDRVKGLQAGADDFLSKPINDMALMSRVRSLLRLKILMDEWQLREKTALQFTDGSRPRQVAGEISIAGSHVLLLEDDGDAADFITTTLGGLSAVVETVTKVNDAASMARTGHYDLIFASLNLANEDSLILCAQLRSDPLTRHIPIVLIGGVEPMPRIAKGLDLGASDYILRPLDANEVIARARTQLRHKRHYDSLRKSYETSLALALVDPLTGAFNRRYMEAHLPRMMMLAEQTQKELSALMIDIDHFKKVNDTYLHAAGDLVLKFVVDRIHNGVRPSDFVARLGGEEFIVIMPETPASVAMMIAERLRAKIASTAITLPGHAEPLTVTVSIGCATTANTTGDNHHRLIERADSALFKAKEQGRNRTVGNE